MRIGRIRNVAPLAALLLFSVGTAGAQSISGIGTANSSSPLNALEASGSIIPALAKFDTLSSVAVTSSAPTTFTTRYISTNSVDSEFLQPARTQTLNSSYQINFTVTAPGLYEIDVDTALVGDLCLDDDNVLPPAGNWAQIFNLSGGQSGGTLAGGSLSIAFPGGSQRLDDTDLSFDPITSPFNLSQSATISGSSFGVPQAHTLTFTWQQQSSTPSAGDPSTIRLGQASRLNDADSCTYAVPARPQAPDGHWVTVTVTNIASCGNGVLNPGEDCDGGPSNGQPGSCCTAGCDYEPPTTVCRSTSVGDDCDEEEQCTGASGSCPADGVADAGTTCRIALGECDEEEQCDGVAKTCPADDFVASGTACTDDGSVCSDDECNGAGACVHPAANFGLECRADAGECDVAEQCDGANPACPPDGFEAGGTACTDDGNVCTDDECNGAGACTHPAGNAGTECRADGGECDVAENCDGASPTCPPDGFEPGGTACTDDGNVCTEDECNGAGACTHPAGNAGTECRADTGDCDVAEECDGIAASCPADEGEDDGTVCTDDGLFCTGDETCQSGTCTSAGDPCGMATCDEGGDQCLSVGCGSAPLNTCRTSEKSILLYKDKSPSTGDRLVYKWIKGQSTDQTDFANPVTSAQYDFCVYAGAPEELLLEANVPFHATKWSPLSTKGYKYKDSASTADGTQKIVLKGSTSNKSKILWKGRGDALPDPAPATLPIPPGDFPVLIQVINTSNGECFESSFDAGDVRSNQSTQLKLKDQ